MYLEQFPFPRQEMMVNVCVYLLLNVKCLLQRFFFSSHVASWMQFSSCSSSLRARTEDRGKWKVFEEVITRHYWWLSDKRTLLSIMPTLLFHVCTVARYSAQHTAQLMLAVNLQIVTCQLVINVQSVPELRVPKQTLITFLFFDLETWNSGLMNFIDIHFSG